MLQVDLKWVSYTMGCQEREPLNKTKEPCRQDAFSVGLRGREEFENENYLRNRSFGNLT